MHYALSVGMLITVALAVGGCSNSDSETVVPATIVAVKGASDVTVRFADGSEASAVLDAEALRKRQGRIYGLNIGGAVGVVRSSPPRIVTIEQAP